MFGTSSFEHPRYRIAHTIDHSGKIKCSGYVTSERHVLQSASGSMSIGSASTATMPTLPLVTLVKNYLCSSHATDDTRITPTCITSSVYEPAIPQAASLTGIVCAVPCSASQDFKPQTR